MTSEELDRRRDARQAAAGAAGRRTLKDFLKDEQLSVLDVLAGAAPGIRRLHVGPRGAQRATFSVCVPRAAAFDEAVADEGRLLAHLAGRLPDDLVATVPRCCEELAGPVSESALVVSAVPGAGPPRRGLGVPALDAVVGWLVALWRSTAGPEVRTMLGHAPLETLVGRARDASSLEEQMVPLLQARQRLATLTVVGAATHGCLCPRHVHLERGVVVGVDDWGAGAPHADPLRDLGRLVVSVVRDELPDVLGGVAASTAVVRRAVGRGLEALALPRSLWREVLLLAQLELAAETAARGNRSGVALLQRTVDALPRNRSREG